MTARAGGNTSCLEVRCGADVLILDAGTGIRALGETLLGGKVKRAHLFFSHLHWDHIQGLPFFGPGWVPGFELEVAGAAPDLAPALSLREALSMQMRPPHFPVRLDDMRATMRFRELGSGDRAALPGGATVTARSLNHPGGVLGLRVDYAGRSLVYATDNEHPRDRAEDPALVELARGADILVYDAMYTEDEYAGRRGAPRVGWGHSTWEAGCAVAEAAGIGQLILFHHDPSRTDVDLDELERLAAIRRPGTIAAREGYSLELESADAEEPTPPSRRPSGAGLSANG
ncbi:MAG: MBL fold metallo-hydrolase, partial [Polyangiaceae bacterium]